MKKMKNNDIFSDNIFSDLESDIDGDWKLIKEKIEKEKEEKKEKEMVDFYKENPQKFNIPSFKEFYNILLEILQSSWNKKSDYDYDVIYYSFKRLINDISRRDNPLPKSFHKVWEIFFHPKYRFITVTCTNCWKTFDVIYSSIQASVNYENLHYYDSTLHCINRDCFCFCGSRLITITNAELIGIFVNDDDCEEKKKYGFESEFRKNF